MTRTVLTIRDAPLAQLDCYGCDATGVARPGYLPTPIEGEIA